MRKELDQRRLDQIDRATPKMAADFNADIEDIRAKIIELLPRFATRDQVAGAIANVRAALEAAGRSGGA